MLRSSMVPALMAPLGLGANAPVAQPGLAPEPVRLGLRDALRAALENNLQVRLAQQARESARAEVEDREGAFDWNLGVQAQASRRRILETRPQPGPGVPDFSQDTITHGRFLTGELTKLLPWGATLAFQYAPAFGDQVSWPQGAVDDRGQPLAPWGGGNPRPYSGALTATYTHRLLRGAGRETTTAGLVAARKRAQAADHAFELALVDLVADTETKYWQAVFAEKSLASKRTALDLAQKLLDANAVQVRVGTLAPIEITFAQAQVAKAEQDLLVLEARLQDARDELVRTLYPGVERTPALELTEAPAPECPHLDEEAALAMALGRRVELKASRLGKESARVQEKAAENLTRPKLDAFLQYDGASRSRASLGAVNGDLARLRNPGYTVGLALALPLQNREAKGRLRGARAQARTSELKHRDQELAIALEVRKALRGLEASAKGVKAAARTRHYQELSLEAERRKFDHGLATSLTVLQIMTSLDEARSDELRSQIDHARAVTAMERAVGNLLEARNLGVLARGVALDKIY